MSINARDRSLYDVYTYSLKTGRLTIVARNDGTVKRWLIDRSLRVRAKVVFSNDGSLYLYARRTIRSVWYLAHTWSPDERLTSGPLSFSPDNSTLYLTSSEGKDTCSLIALTLATGEKKEIAHDPQFDIYLGAHLEDVIPPLPPYQSMLFSDKAELVGFSYYTERLTWHFLTHSHRHSSHSKKY